METYTAAQAIVDIMVIYAIVIVVSLLVAVVIHLIVRTLSRHAEPQPTAASRKPPQSAVATTLPAMGIPPEHLVVITAAVAAMLGPHRLIRIQAPRSGDGWITAGRAAHHQSHRPHKH